MRRLGLAVLCFATGFAALAYANTQDPQGQPASLAHLKEWVGKLPIDPTKSFWDDPILRKEARKAFDVEHYAMLFDGLAKEVISPVEQEGDILFTFVCKEHACNTDNIRFYINLKDNSMASCWHFPNKKNDVWIASGQKPVELDEAGCLKTDDFGLYALYGKK